VTLPSIAVHAVRDVTDLVQDASLQALTAPTLESARECRHARTQPQPRGAPMNHLKNWLACCALASLACALPAHAASSTSSAVSDSASTSVGSLSDSIKKSSNSSSNDKDVAEGDYKIIEVAALADRPGMLRMTLQAMADAPANAPAETAFELVVPQQAFDQGRLAVGQVVTARHHDYGVEFASAATKQAFFLVLEDAWYRDLQTHAVVL
jgi:hypothetical protein